MGHTHKPLTRREFMTRTSLGLGALSFAQLVSPTGLLAQSGSDPLGGAHFAPKAKRIIYLYMSGAPSQLDLFDYKPHLIKMDGQGLPPSVLGDRITSTAATQSSLPIVGTRYGFKQHGESGMWMSDLMPHLSKVTDDLCMVQSMHTESVQHEPGQVFTMTGSELPGRPSFGSWVSYGLGSDNENLPSYIVLNSKGKEGAFSTLFSSAFLPAEHQGVRFRTGKDPVLYLSNPNGITEDIRRNQLDHLEALQADSNDQWDDPDILAKMAQYEMAFKMQTSVPEVMSTDDEPDYVYDLYGPDSKKPGTFASNCLLARRLAERGVKFIQLYHGGWDHHYFLPKQITARAKETDQPTAALITDLKQRGLLDDTLLIWGGEFGRTCFSEGQLKKDNFGRDHHPDAYTVLLAGAGVKKGMTYGSTDEFGYHITDNPVHVHDLNATLLHVLGFDHERLVYRYKGRRFRLTDVHGHVVKDILT